MKWIHFSKVYFQMQCVYSQMMKNITVSVTSPRVSGSAVFVAPGTSPLILQPIEPLWLIPVSVFVALASFRPIIWNGTGSVAVSSCQIPDINKTNYIILKARLRLSRFLVVARQQQPP